MYGLYFIFLCLVKIMSISAEDIQCKENESYKKCATSCPRTCRNMYMPYICNKMCNSRCDCNDGYVKNNEGICVLRSSCPVNEIECPENQEYATCATQCFPRTCSNRNVTPNPHIQCKIICRPGCKCKNNYILDDILNTHLCVLEKDCPSSKCSENEVETDCVDNCQPTCVNPNHSPACKNLDCNPGCNCKPGFFRDERAGRCVEYVQCSMDGEN